MFHLHTVSFLECADSNNTIAVQFTPPPLHLRRRKTNSGEDLMLAGLSLFQNFTGHVRAAQNGKSRPNCQQSNFSVVLPWVNSRVNPNSSFLDLQYPVLRSTLEYNYPGQRKLRVDPDFYPSLLDIPKVECANSQTRK